MSDVTGPRRPRTARPGPDGSRHVHHPNRPTLTPCAPAAGIADAHGLPAVTMRAVASRLGVEAMSLYNHVAHKGDLLDGMVDHAIEWVDLPDSVGDWREAMRRRAVSARLVFRRHPWAPALVDSRVSSGPSRLLCFDWVLGTLLSAGFTIDRAANAFSLLDRYVYGFEFGLEIILDGLARSLDRSPPS